MRAVAFKLSPSLTIEYPARFCTIQKESSKSGFHNHHHHHHLHHFPLLHVVIYIFLKQSLYFSPLSRGVHPPLSSSSCYILYLFCRRKRGGFFLLFLSSSSSSVFAATPTTVVFIIGAHCLPPLSLSLYNRESSGDRRLRHILITGGGWRSRGGGNGMIVFLPPSPVPIFIVISFIPAEVQGSPSPRAYHVTTISPISLPTNAS